MKKLLLTILFSVSLLSYDVNSTKETNISKRFDIDAEIEKIMQAPLSKRRELMNELKRKIYQLNIDLQSSQLINLQHIINTPIHRGKR
ncbi:hypothetical protein NitYY0826_C1484 [Nitratiruptor sp. YY08-26]|uniref:hypothetical protein n=1 Tax=unclassified Nitratiruptor TaxID=2624044 RepID=UPI0019165916|nr:MULTISPECIES: hypothetical protein [unclassified Nitratiruptor]BCD62602.1 hypothetical protein NitYY0813_C1482 [Nitratiruptor sp. YY08-13]BCD66538.1 hypothetical protein NitYY0826_C1484 [Nitratiruptor sp. YY08-26]